MVLVHLLAHETFHIICTVCFPNGACSDCHQEKYQGTNKEGAPSWHQVQQVIYCAVEVTHNRKSKQRKDKCCVVNIFSRNFTETARQQSGTPQRRFLDPEPKFCSRAPRKLRDNSPRLSRKTEGGVASLVSICWVYSVTVLVNNEWGKTIFLLDMHSPTQSFHYCGAVDNE